MNTPYTTSTGIKIGLRYMEQGKRAPIDDPDMQYLQLALLATPNYIKSKRLYERVLVASIITLVFALVGSFVGS